jgi:hypothetical protein
VLAVVPSDVQLADIDILDATRVYGEWRRILRRSAVYCDAADGTEVLSARHGTPSISAHRAAMVDELYLLGLDVPMQESGSYANRAIAIDDLAQRRDHLKPDVPTVAGQFHGIKHVHPPTAHTDDGEILKKFGARHR